MKRLQQLLRLDFVPSSVDLGLLVLRLWLGGSLLVLHGWAKLSNFQHMSGRFPDPFKVGAKASLALAVFGEVIGPLLLITGLFARLGALSSAITMGVAFFFVHRTALKGSGTGELAFIYLAGFVTLFLTGPGRFTIDGKSGKSRGDKKPARDSKP